MLLLGQAPGSVCGSATCINAYEAMTVYTYPEAFIFVLVCNRLTARPHVSHICSGHSMSEPTGSLFDPTVWAPVLES
jgi:hypothetical protein